MVHHRKAKRPREEGDTARDDHAPKKRHMNGDQPTNDAARPRPNGGPHREDPGNGRPNTSSRDDRSHPKDARSRASHDRSRTDAPGERESDSRSNGHHQSSRPRSSRSHSPTRDYKTPNHRTRSPPRGPKADRMRQARLGENNSGGTPHHSGDIDSTQQRPLPPGTRVELYRGSTDVAAPYRYHFVPQDVNKGETKSLDELYVNLDDPEGMAKTEEYIKQKMGFGKFDTTQDKRVPGNDKLYAVRKDKEAKYRQYMNRTGGFNRPLSPSAD